MQQLSWRITGRVSFPPLESCHCITTLVMRMCCGKGGLSLVMVDKICCTPKPQPSGSSCPARTWLHLHEFLLFFSIYYFQFWKWHNCSVNNSKLQGNCFSPRFILLQDLLFVKGKKKRQLSAIGSFLIFSLVRTI